MSESTNLNYDLDFFIDTFLSYPDFLILIQASLLSETENESMSDGETEISTESDKQTDRVRGTECGKRGECCTGKMKGRTKLPI